MSNKKIFKELFEEKINKENNYKSILYSIENNHLKNNIWKKVPVPISSVILICGLILLNINKKSDTLKSYSDNIDQNKDYETNISNNSNSSSFTSNIDIKITNANYKKIIESSNYNFLKNIKIPNDLNNQTYQAIYVKEDKTSDYTLLYNYHFIYQNENNDREIILSFSDKYQPLRDNILSSNEKISKINNNEVIIYQNKNSYITIFTYNNINFDIETNNITYEELISILSSIIK